MSNVSSVASDGLDFTFFTLIQNKHHETYVRGRMGPSSIPYGEYTLNVNRWKITAKITIK